MNIINSFNSSISQLNSQLDFIDANVKSSAIIIPQELQFSTNTIVQDTNISGMMLDLVSNDEINQSYQSTDYYLENNTVINNHIAINPLKINVQGIISEIAFYPKSLPNIFNIDPNILKILNIFLPSFTRQATQFYENIEKYNNLEKRFKETTNNLKNLFNGIFKNDTSKSKQEKAFIFFKNAGNARLLFVIITPFGIYPNMHIEDIRASQTNTKTISEFNLSFKQFNYTYTEYLDFKTTARMKDETTSTINKKVIKDDGKTSLLKYLSTPVFDWFLQNLNKEN